MIVSMLLCSGWHCSHTWDCRALSGAALVALSPTHDMKMCALMFLIGVLLPAFPPSGDESAQNDGNDDSSVASQESWWRELDKRCRAGRRAGRSMAG